jgi:hypothetical protein
VRICEDAVPGSVHMERPVPIETAHIRGVE